MVKPRPRLREQNKQRTRETIVRTAVELFVERGYRQTTLVEIAQAAGVAPSTLHSYFPLKEDLLFSIYDVVIESAREQLLENGSKQTGIDALTAWVADELPAVLTRYGTDVLVGHYEVMTSEPELEPQFRFHDTLLEDVFAAAFARDLDPPDPLRAQVLGMIARHGIREVWDVWTRQHASDSDVAISELTKATVAHVRKLLDESQKAIGLLPKPGPIECDVPPHRKRN